MFQIISRILGFSVLPWFKTVLFQKILFTIPFKTSYFQMTGNQELKFPWCNWLFIKSYNVKGVIFLLWRFMGMYIYLEFHSLLYFLVWERLCSFHFLTFYFLFLSFYNFLKHVKFSLLHVSLFQTLLNCGAWNVEIALLPNTLILCSCTCFLSN